MTWKLGWLCQTPSNKRLALLSAFLCEKPKRLVVPQQMRGYPKLWQLPSKTATTLTTALKAPPDSVPFSWAQFGKHDGHDAKADEPSSHSGIWYEKYRKAKKEQAQKR